MAWLSARVSASFLPSICLLCCSKCLSSSRFHFLHFFRSPLLTACVKVPAGKLSLCSFFLLFYHLFVCLSLSVRECLQASSLFVLLHPPNVAPRLSLVGVSLLFFSPCRLCEALCVVGFSLFSFLGAYSLPPHAGLIFAVDFTQSNEKQGAHSFYGLSLHHIFGQTDEVDGLLW